MRSCKLTVQMLVVLLVAFITIIIMKGYEVAKKNETIVAFSKTLEKGQIGWHQEFKGRYSDIDMYHMYTPRGMEQVAYVFNIERSVIIYAQHGILGKHMEDLTDEQKKFFRVTSGDIAFDRYLHEEEEEEENNKKEEQLSSSSFFV